MSQTSERPDAHYEPEPRHGPWWLPWLVAAVAAALIIGLGSFFVYGRDQTPASMEMGRAEPHVPPVTGYYNGEEIQFLHTEASDPKIAAMLTDMMDSLVVTVPPLADVPKKALAPVFVFQDGIKPEDKAKAGPFGFQPDVFNTVPGQSGYTPLRTVHLVDWRPGATPRLLKSAQEISRAEQADEVTVTEPGVVVNMPVVTWPGGSR